jgi:rSAM/selenodomain-associated transferase 1
MSRRPTLIVFVKAPRLGQVKSRLAADIGAVAATRFYRRTTADLLRRLGRDRRWRSVLAVTPDRDIDAPFWPRRDWRRMAQGPGDLGQRMARCLAAAAPGPAVLVGSDIPGIRAHHVARAFRSLGDADSVFGPATDGGYWLVGIRHRKDLRGLFTGVRWSTKHALADTVENLGPGRKATLVETLMDIDEGTAYERWSGR